MNKKLKILLKIIETLAWIVFIVCAWELFVFMIMNMAFTLVILADMFKDNPETIYYIKLLANMLVWLCRGFGISLIILIMFHIFKEIKLLKW